MGLPLYIAEALSIQSKMYPASADAEAFVTKQSKQKRRAFTPSSEFII